MSEHGGNREEIADYLGINKSDLIDFSANINPLGLSENLLNVLKKNITELQHYPDIKYRKLKKAIANYHGVSSSYVFPGNGEAEVIYLLAQVLRPRHVLLLAPTFSEYEKAFNLVGSRFSYFYLNEEEGFEINPINFFEFLDNNSQIDCICLCNPNNPTGKVISKKLLTQLLGRCSVDNISLILDEAFIDFLPNTSDFTMIDELTNSDNLYILRSLTKFYAIPGLRLGYLLTHNVNTLQKMALYKIPWSINILADVIGQNILFDESFQIQTHNFINTERQRLQNELEKFHQIKVYSSSANYLLLKVTDISEFRNKLLNKRILIRSCSNYRGLTSNYYRVAVKSVEDNQYLIEAITEVCRNETDSNS
ncbi:threonine-phosphate decarboxylase CobD [Vagococcus fessus]|uniref:threonine-phosphate decarboxylase n=1 Tax=Vagococcus fessus TaxID=120370 RepID=A0A430AD09_9ENTE|nr:threonine-phosphate decarboxylase CobD [Vagococcus fessus]RSU05106.1 threonine-phosphate decarboxylase [Vagococcus fessus]